MKTFSGDRKGTDDNDVRTDDRQFFSGNIPVDRYNIFITYTKLPLYQKSLGCNACY